MARFFIRMSFGMAVFCSAMMAEAAFARDDNCNSYDETNGLQCFNCMERVQTENGWKLVNVCNQRDHRAETDRGGRLSGR